MRVIALVIILVLAVNPGPGKLLILSSPCRIPVGGSGYLNVTVKNVFGDPMENVTLRLRPYAKAHLDPLYGIIVEEKGPFPEVPTEVRLGEVVGEKSVSIPVRAEEAGSGSYLVAVQLTFSLRGEEEVYSSPGWSGRIADGRAIPDLSVSVISSRWASVRILVIAILVAAIVALSLVPEEGEQPLVKYRCEGGHEFYHVRGLKRCPICGSKVTPS